jgi:hypothetical protein
MAVLTKRLVKGSLLTLAEGDGNLEFFENEIAGKADLAVPADAGNVAALDALGNLEDTGEPSSDLHAHANKAALDLIGEDEGSPTWNGGAWPGGGGFDPASPGAIGETTPATIRSLLKEVVKTSTGNLSAAEVSGTLINNYGQADDCALTLPAAASGLSCLVVCGTAVAKYLRIKGGASDKIFLDGTAGANGEYIGLAAAVQGAAVSLASFQTGAESFEWLATTISGTWEAE